jgi:hypothetical protein
MRLLGILIALTAAATLTACAGLDKKISQVSESEELTRICRIAPAMHGAFILISTETKIPASIKKGEAAAYGTLMAVCANPPSNTGEALATAAAAYADILSAKASADGV